MAQVLDQAYELVPLTSVRPHPQNPRLGDVAALGRSIEANGFYGALVVQRSTGHILVGNHRYKAALAAGVTELPALVIDVNDERAKRILLVDNRAAELATWDEDALAAMLAELAGTEEELSGTLYTADDLAALVDGEGTYAPAGDGSMLARADLTVGEPTRSVERGQVWNVGRHVMVVADVLIGWPLWSPYLHGDDLVFAPYPSPFLPFSEKLAERRLLLVQPNLYLAGHLLDKYAAITGEEPTEHQAAP